MEEKILIKSDRYSIGKGLCVIAILVAIICAVVCIVRYCGFKADYELCKETVWIYEYPVTHYRQKCYESEPSDKCGEHRLAADAKGYATWETEETFQVGCGITVGVSLLCSFVYFWLRSYEIVVTDKRVYGKAAFGKRVDLPMDSVSAVGSTWPKGISVATSSGRIAFLIIENRDAIHKCVSDLLIERQSKSNAVPAVAAKPEEPMNNANELRKYKELLDDGVITQEEFDAKKKQLLGL